jgi:hypothetical protein
MKKTLLLCGLFVLILSQSFGQFQLKGEFRPRFEYRDGYGQLLSKDQDPVLTISNRTRLSAYYQTGILTFGLGIQDVRVWGDDDLYSRTGVVGSKASIDLNEGWIGIKIYKNGSVKIGRQYWVYEDERIFSQRSWNQSEVKYDGVLYQHIQDQFQVDVGMSWNNAAEKAYNDNYPHDKMKSINFIYVKKKINDWLNASVTAIASGFTATDTTKDINWQGTYGAYLTVKKGGLTALASGYYQSGRNRFSGDKTSAYMFAVNGDYLIKKKFSVGAGIDYLSGQDQKNADADYTEKAHSFDVLYGMTHRFLGHMDLFTDLHKSTKDAGIVDIFVRAKFIFAKEKANVGADFHLFSLQNNLAYISGEETFYYDKGLGQELDLYTSWDINKIFNLRAGFSTYFSSDTMDKLQGVYGNARTPGWIWIMLTAKPVFLDTAQK